MSGHCFSDKRLDTHFQTSPAEGLVISGAQTMRVPFLTKVGGRGAEKAETAKEAMAKTEVNMAGMGFERIGRN